WCFQQPWVLETEEERMKAAALLKGWEKRVQHRAALLGWKLDSVGDLARVLRPTGTWNRKPSRPAPVKVTALKCDGPRYAPGDFEPHLLAISASHKKATSSHGILGGTPSPVLLGMGEEHTANTETRSATPVGQIDQRRDRKSKVDTGDGRNNTGFWLACQLRDNGHSQAEAEATVLAYAERMPPTNTKGELEPYTVADALASVRSAYQQPAREPWRVARAAAVVADAITKARETSDPSVAFDAADALANLPVAEYARGKDALRQALGRRLNLNDLERAVKEARRKHQAET
ncbi:MAG: hypothetical protein NTZ05_13190, partial [Chloroflexi bacterium]|nr:hypothetical protein [Chloroflexota bacterium]